MPLGYAVSWPGALLAAAAVGLTQSAFIALGDDRCSRSPLRITSAGG